jgi:hypothetical protein
MASPNRLHVWSWVLGIVGIANILKQFEAVSLWGTNGWLSYISYLMITNNCY